MNITISGDGKEFCVSRGGFWYGDFDKAGKVSISRVQSINGGAGVSTLKPLTHRVLKTAVFVCFQKTEVKPEFYTIASISSPWQLRFIISHVGKTSFLRESEMYCQKTGAILVRGVVKLVAVDSRTRRPTSIPDEFSELVLRPAKKTTPQKFDFPEVLPDDEKSVFSMSIATMPSDVDYNGHVGSTVCSRYCLDCASVASIRGGVLSKFSQEMAFYNLKSFSVEFLSEIRDGGKELNVQCWEDPINACILYFVVRAGEKTAYRCVGEWYADESGQPVEHNNGLNFLEGAVSKL